MTPGGRLQAAIEILDAILSPPEGRGDVPADIAVSGYLRKRRYIGSKDRRAITGHVWASLRRRGLAQWAMDGAPIGGRALLLATLAGEGGWSDDEIEAAFDGTTYAPPPLDDGDRAVMAAVRAAGDPPPAARANMPEWLAAEAAAVLGPVLGEADGGAWEALSAEAPTVLRVNTLKADRATVAAALEAAGIGCAPTPLSPVGLALTGRANLTAVPAFRDGWVEVQDEGSQIAALLCDARPGMRVLDYCAGGGGKALALAATMAGEGTVVATDTDAGRLQPLAQRTARAGAAIVESRTIAAGETVEPGTFDRVLVDAPCSGSGAWRRRPEAPWRLTPERYAALQQAQAEILSAAAASVRPGGRLIYVTCSVFPAENDAVVRGFLDGHPAFRACDPAGVWADVIGAPASDRMIEGDIVRLLPHISATDGFCIAIFERNLE